MRKIHRIATCLLVGTLAFAGKSAIAQAAEDPVAGIDLALDELYQSNDKADEEIKEYLQESEYDNLAFAQVTNYVNIRSEASENGEILGKLYNNSAATIIAKKGSWYEIKSGSVTGYIKAEFLVTGSGAAKLAKSVGNRVATVTTTTLKVRDEASTDALVVTLVALGDDLKVLKELDGWVKVSFGNSITGYVSAEYVDVQTVYEEAVSIEEEQASIEDEAAADNNTSESSSSANNSHNNSTSNNSSKSSSPSESSAADDTQTDNSNSSSSNSSVGSRIADYAVQFRGNPYVWGGTSLTGGADCSGFTQSVFAHFGIYIPRTSRTQATGGRRVSIDNLKPGDLVFYARGGTINHVAIYIGGGRVISASSPSTGIRITNLYYRSPYKAVSYLD